MTPAYKYSIIIPHFNDEVGLKRLLSTIPIREDIQVLVVDDKSSTNQFEKIIIDCGLLNIEGYINDRNKSAGTCRNIGLEKAVGEYLIFADSDDFFPENAFQIIDEEIGRNAGFDVYYFSVHSSCEDGTDSNRHRAINSIVQSYLKNPNMVNEQKLRLTHYVPWGKVILRKLVSDNKIVFDQTLVANDGMFSLAVGQNAKYIFASDKVVYCSLVRSNSLTTKRNYKNFRLRLDVYVRYYKSLSKSEISAIEASPAAIIYQSLQYGIIEFLRTLCVLKIKGVPIFTNITKKIPKLNWFRE